MNKMDQVVEDTMLFQFIDSVESKINASQKLFFAQWNFIIKSNLMSDEKFDIEQYVDICGGFFLDKHLYNKMNVELKKFFSKKKLPSNEKDIYLRGYDYYQADPVMHIQGESINRDYLWKSYNTKWKDYHAINSFSYLVEGKRISIADWIGTLSLLEYLFNDLTALRWFEFKSKSLIMDFVGKDYFDIVDSTERYADIIGHTIACMLNFDIDRAYELLQSNYNPMTHSKYIERLLCLDFENIGKESIRAVREGDSICLIYAAYLMKLKPFFETKQAENILLVSNAFGAMNIGIILKYLMKSHGNFFCSNSLFYQNRAIEDEVYGKPESDICCIIDEKGISEESYQFVIVVDDSVFTGTSYSKINNILFPDRNVYLLPLTVNCNCLKYCRRGIRKGTDVYDIAQQVVEWSTQVGSRIAPFTSFWDFDHAASENKIHVENQLIQPVLNGNDLLKKHLWVRFMKDILNISDEQ